MTTLRQKFHDFFYKTHLNHDVDPLEFYLNFYYLGSAFQVLENQPKPLWTYLSSIILPMNAVVAGTLFATSVYHGIRERDLLYTTEFITYLVLMVYKLLAMYTIRVKTFRFHNFARELKEDFRYIANEGSKYRERYFKNQIFIWQASMSIGIFTFAIAIGMLIFAIMELVIYLHRHEPGDRDHRPIPLQYWFFDIDFGKSPTFEINFFMGCMFICTHLYLIIFTLSTCVIWVMQITSKADIVIWSIEDLLADINPLYDVNEEQRITNIIKKRMSDIVSKHQSMYKLLDDYAAVYKILLMYEQKLGFPLICLTAYCTAETLEEGNVDTNSMFIFMSLVVILYVPCYMCTFLSDKIISVADACWDIPFWQAGRLVSVIRPYLLLIMQKALRPLVLQAPGFKDISVETYANNMAAAYSWFNMLRQSNIK